jgi:transposase
MIKEKSFLEMILDKKPDKKVLDKMGISESEYKEFMKTMIEFEQPKYNRVMSSEEKEVLTPEAFGYLIDLLQMGSIDDETMERIIIIALQVGNFVKQHVTRQMVDEILNFIIFSGQRSVSVKDILDLLILSDHEFDFGNEVN